MGIGILIGMTVMRIRILIGTTVVHEWPESTVWDIHVWAVTRGFGTFCPPSRLSSNEHAQPSSLMSVQNLRLVLYFMCASIEGDWETVRMHRRAWVFGVHICDAMNIEDLTWLAISYEMYNIILDLMMEHEKRQTTNVQGSLRICNEYKKVPII